MTTTPTTTETVPTAWDDARDGAFFRLTARLFTPDFCFGAGVLLASYDDAAVTAVEPAGAECGTSSTSAAVGTRSERDLVPVRVRRTR